MLARTVGKDAFSPLAAECVQLGLNLTDAVDDPDLRRCTYDLCVCSENCVFIDTIKARFIGKVMENPNIQFVSSMNGF